MPINEDGWPDAVATWVPRLMPALRTALFHGVIGPPCRAGHRRWSTHRRGAVSWPGRWVTGRPTTVKGSRPSSAAGLRAAAGGVRRYLARPDIFHLHGVTGPAWTRTR